MRVKNNYYSIVFLSTVIKILRIVKEILIKIIWNIWLTSKYWYYYRMRYIESVENTIHTKKGGSNVDKTVIDAAHAGK